MGNQEIATLDLPKSIIEPIVRAQLSASIIAALGGAEQLVGQVVHSLMSKQVDNNGNPSTSSYGTQPMITWMSEKAIKEAASEAIKEWFAANRDKIKALILESLKKNAKGLAEALVLGVENTIKIGTKYEFEITVQTKKDNR